MSGHYRPLTLAKHFALKTLLNVVGFVRVSKGKTQDKTGRGGIVPSPHATASESIRQWLEKNDTKVLCTPLLVGGSPFNLPDEPDDSHSIRRK